MISNLILDFLFALVIIYVFVRGNKTERILAFFSIIFFIVNTLAIGYYITNVSGYLYSIVSSVAITIIFKNTIKRKDYVWSILSFLLLLFFFINLMTLIFVLFL
jgi:hypothetical protein